MKVIEVRNSKKTIEQLTSDVLKTGFIHRKNIGDVVRFNPNLKNYIIENNLRIAFGIEDEKMFLLLHSKYDWKPTKQANMKATTFTSALDDLGKTNRYSLTFVKNDEEVGIVFEIKAVESVDEREYELSEERKETLRNQINNARVNKKNENKAMAF
jgi:hypothetical protein